jgi:protein-S-isoprenylcysteine O-methyltransferase Ste14
MVEALVWMGIATGISLVLLLVATLLRPTLRIWPTPGPGSRQSHVFWPLFRGLNVLSVSVAAATAAMVSSTGSATGPATIAEAAALGLPFAVRCVALAVAVLAFLLFLYAFHVLGRDNSYGAREGLVTEGIYRWSRNPQNALLMVVHGALAVAADTLAAWAVGGSMVAVYALMVSCEEPWLEAAYGEAYREYCRRVPRFFGWARR